MTDLIANGEGSVVVIEGEAGIGKSTLLDSVRREAEFARLTLLEGSGSAIDQSTPYHGWRGVLAGLLDLPAFADATLRERRITELVGPEFIPLAPLLNAVMPLGLPENDTTRLLEGRRRADATRDLMVEAITRSAGGRPLVIMLEDAHWFDQASWDLAEFAAVRVPMTLMVVCARPQIAAGRERIDSLTSLPGARHLRIVELDRAATSQLAAQRLGVRSIPAEVEDLLYAKADGHPLYTEELALTLRDRGLITADGDDSFVSPGVDLSTVALPDTLQGVITARIDQMTPLEVLTLKVASVIETIFPYRILHDVHPIEGERDGLHRTLAAMGQTTLVRPEPNAAEEAWAFKHALTRDAAYQLLLFVQRQELHAAVATWYESLPQTSPYYGVLAHHWQAAGENGKAAQYLALELARIFADAGLGRAAVNVGLDALALLGESIPRTVPEIVERVGAELQMSSAALAVRTIDDLKDSPQLADPAVAARIGTILAVLPYVHQSNQLELFALLALRALNLTLESGHFIASPVVYSMYSILVRNLLGDSRRAYDFSRLALDLDAANGGPLRPVCGFVHYWFQDHWFNAIGPSIGEVRNVIESAQTLGDWQYERFLLSMDLVHTANSGASLQEVISRGRTYIPLNGNRVRNAAFHLYHETQYAKALAGLTTGQVQPDGRRIRRRIRHRLGPEERPGESDRLLLHLPPPTPLPVPRLRGRVDAGKPRDPDAARVQWSVRRVGIRALPRPGADRPRSRGRRHGAACPARRPRWRTGRGWRGGPPTARRTSTTSSGSSMPRSPGSRAATPMHSSLRPRRRPKDAASSSMRASPMSGPRSLRRLEVTARVPRTRTPVPEITTWPGARTRRSRTSTNRQRPWSARFGHARDSRHPRRSSIAVAENSIPSVESTRYSVWISE